ncbi:xanthine dehydrogenase family protein molybdopterin-binding subunit [Rhodococcus sp. HNM0569]|uniref:molybdopterin cofactor-binding domain-containing protein n=1 Tax=Rhodococcus sp. HNM0569 TaxID=2716340 RepID=UPI00146C746E|nr:xanthine dehydrogenase family protein molybdopterin-binding subunit [Rhodococcus sp. HNM0569]
MTAVGRATTRLDGPAKVRGAAPYAYEHDVEARAYLHAITSTVARGTVVTMDTAEAEAVDGVLTVLNAWTAPSLADTSDGEFTILQAPEVAFRGQIVGAVAAETPEAARHAASLVHVEYDEETHDTGFHVEHPAGIRPAQVNGGNDTETGEGDVDAAFAAGPAFVVDEFYSTPEEHNNPLEPHCVVAHWEPDDEVLTLYDSTQSAAGVADALAPVLGLDAGRIHVISPYVGGGFGSKGAPHAHNVLAALAAWRLPGRSIVLAVTRQQMFEFVGYRSPTVSHLRLGADADGRLVALVHDATVQTATVKEFAEQAAVPSRTMYAARNRRTSHRLVPLDVPIPFWMRAPGEAPGMFALEVAMDELAERTGIDPIELRVRNEPDVDPQSGKPWSSRRLVDCLRDGADWFGWAGRDPAPATRVEGRYLVGTGVASATYPHMYNTGSSASVRLLADDRYAVCTSAADIGTGALTALTLVAADALGVPPERIDMQIGDSALPAASVAGGSSGTVSWSSAIVAAAREFRVRHGDEPEIGATVTASTPENPALESVAAHSFGAHFAQVRVDRDTGEIRVSRMRSVFSVGRVVNPVTVRSQFLGGMTFGLSMALQEESIRDHRFGHVVTHDLASYHFPVNADIEDLDARWLDETDDAASPLGIRGAGEIGIVGSAAAVANAVWHATGVRVRQLPVHADDLLAALP